MNIWGRSGLSVAVVAIFYVVIAEVLRDKAFYELHRWTICTALLAMGVFLVVVGQFVNARIRESRRNDADGPAGPPLLVNLQYWGLVLVAFGIIVAIIVPARAVMAREGRAPLPKTNTVRKTVVPATNDTPKPVVFPELKLQGVVLRDGNSSALINGRTYFVGHVVGEARLISITESNVTVELRGQQRSLRLPD